MPTLTVYVYHRESPSPHVRARARELYQHHVATVQRALELGVPIAAGTDAGGHGHPKNALEIVYLVEAGLTPMQALRAATQWAAKCLGLERELGTVEKGRLADLVVVDGNPLDDVKVLLEPERHPARGQGRRGLRGPAPEVAARSLTPGTGGSP